jgi:hypothetical protein
MPHTDNLCQYYYNDGKCWYKIYELDIYRGSHEALCPSEGQPNGCYNDYYIPRREHSCFNCEGYEEFDNTCHRQGNTFHPIPADGCVSFVKIKEEKITGKYKSQDGFEIIKLQRGFTEIIPLWKILNKVISSTKKDCFICGGYARYCASPKFEVKSAGDVDIYSEDESAFNKLKHLLSIKGLKVKSENDMAVTYERPTKGEFHCMPPIQAIKPLKIAKIVSVGTKEEILSNFDFTIIRAAIESPTEVLVDKDFIHDETHNVMRLKNIHCPVSSTLRCLKYAQKGYWLRPLEALKLFLDWDNRSDDYRLKLVEFLDKADEGTGLTQEQVDELEALMRID